MRNFYKVEKWTKDGSKVDSLLFIETRWRVRQPLHLTFHAQCPASVNVTTAAQL